MSTYHHLSTLEIYFIFDVMMDCYVNSSIQWFWKLRTLTQQLTLLTGVIWITPFAAILSTTVAPFTDIEKLKYQNE